MTHLKFLTGKFTLTSLFIFSFLFSHAEFKVVGYLYNWGNFVQDAQAVDYTKVTHINIAFLNPNNAGVMTPTNNLNTVVNIIHNGNAKAIVSVGGANSPSSWATLMQAANRSAFIHTTKQFLKQYNLDGIDIDLEGSAIDNNYSDFIVELSDSLIGTGITLTAAVATWNGNSISNAALARFDFINIMSYDQYGTWSGPGQHSSYAAAVNDLNYWGTTRGIAKEKLILGLPSYGYRWETNSKSSLTFKEIVNLFPGTENDDHIKTITNGDIYYNGIPTIKQKTTLAIDHAGGIMWWAMQFDFPSNDSKSLLKAMHDVIQATNGNKKPTISLITPQNNNVFTEGDAILISANANDSDGVISFVSFYADNDKLAQDTGTNFQFSWKTAGPGIYKIHAMAVDDAYASVFSDTIYITVNSAIVQSAFGGKAQDIPGKVEAENFDIGSNLGYYDLTAGNNGSAYRTGNVDIESCSDNGGGYSVGWIQMGEWLEYTINVTQDTIYDIRARVAATANNKAFHIEINEENIAHFAIPSSGGWQNWLNVVVNDVHLTQGEKTIKIVFETGDFNLNYLDFTFANPSSNIGVHENEINPFSIYPNPAQNELHFNGKTTNSIKIYDIAGKLMMQENTIQNNALDISNLATGIYTVVINNSDFVKLIKN
jgi:hypothetical protein